MKYVSYFVLSFLIIGAPAWTGCRHNESRQQCNRAPACVWDSRGCSVGSRPLEADSKGDTIQDNFEQKYSLKKAN